MGADARELSLVQTDHMGVDLHPLPHPLPINQSEAQKSPPASAPASAPICHVICLSQSDLLKLERICSRIRSHIPSQERMREQIPEPLIGLELIDR